jgi:hypothetical protein
LWIFYYEEKTMNSNLEALISELRNRAKIYLHIYREISKELGEDRAAEILKRAIYARGKEKGVQLAGKLGAPDLHQLALNFVEGKGDMDAFGHEIIKENPDYVLLRLNRCPLMEGWEEAGLAPEERKLLCDIAYQVDFGKFEGAGYRLAFNCRIADGSKSCDLKVTLK